MNCADCQDNLVAHLEGLLKEQQISELESHLRYCPVCSAEAEELDQLRSRLWADGQVSMPASLRTGVMEQISQKQKPKMEKFIMRKRSGWASMALVAAAAIAAIIILSIPGFETSNSSGYALGQTIEANRSIRFFHIRIEPAGSGISEAWAQYDEAGELLQLRMDFPNTEDGPKVVVWEADKAEVWFKAKNSAIVIREKQIADRFLEMLALYDPKIAVEQLYEAQANQEVEIAVLEPAEPGSPIILVASRKNEPARQDHYRIDSTTKLLQRIETYELNGDEWELVRQHDFLTYHPSDETDVFTLNLPDDVIRIDQTTQAIGLAKGKLTDAQITVKLVREFFEALIAKDYAHAGQLLQGMPAAKMQEVYGQVGVVRIIAIGEPEPHPIPGVGGLQVECRVEIERDGVKSIFECKPAARPVHSQPDRWTIHGGI